MGYGYLSATLFFFYLPSFFDNSSMKGGRPWPWYRYGIPPKRWAFPTKEQLIMSGSVRFVILRKHKLWDLLSNYVNLVVIRERKLDASKKVFSWNIT